MPTTSLKGQPESHGGTTAQPGNWHGADSCNDGRGAAALKPRCTHPNRANGKWICHADTATFGDRTTTPGAGWEAHIASGTHTAAWMCPEHGMEEA